MKLDAYLKGLKECPDEWVQSKDHGKLHRLTYDFGIYGNYRTFLDCTRERAEEIFRGINCSPLRRSEFLSLYRNQNRGIKFALNVNRNGTPFLMHDEVCQYPFATYLWIEQSTSHDDSREYLEGRDLVLMLMPALDKSRVRFTIETSFGWKNLTKAGKILPEGYDQIVYSPDSLDSEMQRLRKREKRDHRK
ncbi:MAG: hypothetical protein PHF67_00450 [Candidatus Nanoarchaeia archaeon]|nr:hypothetical protein [Candidatus Nanoarchaeia archaeon]